MSIRFETEAMFDDDEECDECWSPYCMCADLRLVAQFDNDKWCDVCHDGECACWKAFDFDSLRVYPNAARLRQGYVYAHCNRCEQKMGIAYFSNRQLRRKRHKRFCIACTHKPGANN